MRANMPYSDLEVLREVDSRHPAPSDFTLDPVAVGESLLHSVE